MIKHTRLNELVADLRNKIGSMYGYFSILERYEKMEEGELKEKFSKILKDAKESSINYLPIVKNLMEQFENFDLDRSNNK